MAYRKGVRLGIGFLALSLFGGALLASCKGEERAVSPDEKTAAPARTKAQINDPNEPHPGLKEKGGGK